MKKDLLPLLWPRPLLHTTSVTFTRSPLIVYRTLLAVERYPTFMTWCKGAEVVDKGVSGWKVNLTIGFPPVLLHCTSLVTMKEPLAVHSVFTKNKLFELFELDWKLQPGEEVQGARGLVPVHTCHAQYTIKFTFASPAFNNLTKVVLNTVCTETAKAFAKEIENDKDHAPALYDSALKEFVLVNRQ